MLGRAYTHPSTFNALNCKAYRQGEGRFTLTLNENNDNERSEHMDAIEARQAAAQAMDAGQKLAQRAAQMRRGLPGGTEPSAAALGALLADPANFWAGATASQARGDEDTVAPVVLGLKLAGARLAAGDMGFVRDALIGQATWLGVVAVRMMAQAESARSDQSAQFVKLALAAQRQAAQAMCSAAALGKLGVEVPEDN